ncbi:translocation/assembly module TamB domain-containing protein [Jannaschia sp. Os4]|uniref:translocation/assembly module TamB domain-containing protein n=1 Tax=Jannaschia sp. Os4 TaxID=2807617 RepID=UPI00193A0143|nr:translocation/assembly module TamB domain-containing protein [Jannaschia sp. Os4]MBM2574898.1 translocation/assembly module TamB domain-containing protein [Jannaschia sp. Os4]
MKRLLPALLLCAAPALAQEERDRGFIVGLIEDNLSAPGLSMRLDGFEGALSSRATLDLLSVSDDEGEWLRLEDVVLDWNRSALLRGRLEVEELTAGLIEVVRTPLPPEGFEPPPAGAGGFSIPELPVSVEIERLAAERIRLGEALVGQPVEATLEASATLADGALDVDARAGRLDGPEGTFAVVASYAPGGTLSVDVDVSEAPGGIAASLLGLPGEPSVDLSVQGTGPLSDFAADIRLATDGAERLGGTVAVGQDGGDRTFAVDLAGDVTALLAPRYREFFGEDVALVARGRQAPDGALSLEALDLDAKALDVAGRVEIGEDGWPRVIDLTATVADTDGGPVLLPVGGTVTVGGLDLRLAFDAAVSDEISLDATLTDLSTDTVELERAALVGRGTIDRDAEAGTNAVGAAAGRLALEADGLAFVDPALGEAAGTGVALETDVAWRPSEPLRLTGLALEAGDLSVAGDVAAGAIGEGLPLTLDIEAEVPRLARFAALARLDLAGAVEVALTGEAAPLAGSFDLTLDGTATDLVTGIAQADGLLSGRTDLALRARRDETGTYLEDLDLSNPQVTATGSATILSEEAPDYAVDDTGSARLSVRLADVSPLVPQIDGPADLTLDLQGGATAWRGTAGIAAPDGIRATASGTLTGPATDVEITAEVPDLSVLVDALEGGAVVTGRAFRDGEAFAVDLTGTGPWNSRVTATGPVTGPDAEIAFTAELPRLGDVTLLQGALPEGLAGAAEVAGTLASEEGAWVIDADLATDAGVAAEVEGPVAGRPLDLAVALDVPDLTLVAPVPEGLQGPATLRGRVFDEAGLRVDLVVDGPAGLDAGVEGALAPLALDVTAAVEDLSALAPVPEALAGPAVARATVADADGAITVDAALSLPQDIAATATGTAAGGPLDVGFAARVPAVEALGLIPGPVAGEAVVQGRVRSVGAGLAVDVRLEGPEGIEATVSGPVTGPSLDVEIEARAPDIARLANVPPQLSGPATLSATARRDGEAIVIDADLDGPGFDLTAQGPVTGAEVDATFRAAVDDLAALAGLPETLTGRATLEGRLTGSSQAYVLDADLDAPAGITASVDGQLTGPGADADVSLRVPDLSDLAAVPPALAGPLTLDGRLTQVDGAPALDATLTAPAGIEVTVDGPLTGPGADATFSAVVPRLGALANLPAPYAEGAARLDGRLTSEGGSYVVDADLAAPAGITASVAGPVTGDLSLDVAARVPDLAAAVPGELPGALRGPVTLEGTVTRPDAIVVDLRADGPSGIVLRVEGPATGPDAALSFAATVPEVEAFVPGVPGVEGTVSADGVLARMGADWTLTADLRGPAGTAATVDTVLTDQPLTLAVDVSVPTLSTFAPGVPGGLDAAGTVTLAPEGVQVDLTGGGPYGASFALQGVATGEAPELDLTARVPDASVLAPQLRGPLALDATATQRGGNWFVDADANGAQGLRASVSGQVTGDLAVDFSVDAANVAAFAPGLNGPLSATGTARQVDGRIVLDADASGPFGSRLSVQGPVTGGVDVTYDLSLPDVSPLIPDFAGPLRARGTARQQGDAIAVQSDIDGPGGTQATVSGTVGGAGGLGLSVQGTAPLGLANPFLEPNRIAGTAAFDLRIADGGLDGITGTVTTSGAALSLPTLSNGLEGIDARIVLTGGRAQIDVTASVATGGRIAVRGPVDLSAPFDAALVAELDVLLEDPTLYTTRARGEISITGPLTGGARIAGRVVLDDTEISVPSTGLTALGDLPPITHVNVRPEVRRTLDRAGLDLRAAAEGASGGGGGPVYSLDLVLQADRIFVRGRGLDAELGGSLRITGTTANPVTAGGFDLVRGRLDVLQQRFQLDEGSISFQGSLTPFIRLVARAEGASVDAAIVVEGPADALEVRFESAAGLPQEEIIAQLFFGRDLSQLSPLQALQLASSVATLAGGGSGGVLENLRGAAGLDDLDITTDAQGNTAVRVGKYITDNVYTDVQVGQDGTATLSLNLDVTQSLTVRGSVGGAGDTSVGIFFERDYGE